MPLLNDMHTDWNERDNDRRLGLVTLLTDGKGFWSEHRREVEVTEIKLGFVDAEDEDFGELRVHFNTDSWRPDKHGLIYTDRTFERGLRTWLNSIGLAGDDVSYSEQGMQGDNYVSCDVGEKFLKSYKAKYPEDYQAALS